MASQDATNNNTQTKSTEFVPDPGGAPSTDAGTMLVVAYCALWLILFGFILLGWRRQKRIAERLERLEKTLKEAPTDDAT
jgi:CcmD family protein